MRCAFSAMKVCSKWFSRMMYLWKAQYVKANNIKKHKSNRALITAFLTCLLGASPIKSSIRILVIKYIGVKYSSISGIASLKF